MGVPDRDVAFTKNTAHGISIVADGLDWHEGDEVVFADCEYPANSYPWLAQAWRSVQARIVRTPADGRLSTSDYVALINNRTRIVAVSWVQFSTGFRVNLAELVDIAHKHGALVLVDVIQGLGAMPIDLSALGVDMAATGSQKWLIGPMGVGALYINPNVLEHLRPVNVGAGSVNNVVAFDPLGFDLKPTAQRFEEGTPNLCGVVGLNAATASLVEHGAVSISEAVLAVTRYAMERLRSRGFRVISPENDSERAGIVLFRHDSIPNDAIMSSLESAKVNAAIRGGSVRFSPHFYNNESDIDQAVDALPAG